MASGPPVTARASMWGLRTTGRRPAAAHQHQHDRTDANGAELRAVPGEPADVRAVRADLQPLGPAANKGALGFAIGVCALFPVATVAHSVLKMIADRRPDLRRLTLLARGEGVLLS
jgi:hypothetical protein